jgi:hypothetical protein
MELDRFIGREVVVDTSSPLVFIGTLKKTGADYIEMEDVDVFDQSRCASTKDVYLISAKKTGVRKNRRSTVVRTAVIVSVSPLDDIIEY